MVGSVWRLGDLGGFEGRGFEERGLRKGNGKGEREEGREQRHVGEERWLGRNIKRFKFGCFLTCLYQTVSLEQREEMVQSSELWGCASGL